MGAVLALMRSFPSRSKWVRAALPSGFVPAEMIAARSAPASLQRAQLGQQSHVVRQLDLGAIHEARELDLKCG